MPKQEPASWIFPLNAGQEIIKGLASDRMSEIKLGQLTKDQVTFIYIWIR